MPAVDSILIVRTSAIGDVIQAFLALDYLRQRFPHAQIDWVAEQSVVDLLSAHPSISHYWYHPVTLECPFATALDHVQTGSFLPQFK